MVHIVIKSDLNWCVHLSRSLFLYFMGLLHHPFWLQLVQVPFGHHFQFLSYFVWLRIIDEGSVPEMRI